MVQVNDNLCIDAYEASVFENADCTGQQYGVGQDDYPAGFPEHVASSGCEAECAAHSTEAQTQAVYACSIGGVMPSTMLTWFRAKAACENAGKALCASGEWMAACGGPDGTQYPFGASWAGQCNTVYDMRAALVTGADPACVGGMPGLFDMGGNVAEWVNACGSTDCQYYGGSFNQSEDFLECANPDSLTATAAFGDLGFRCCARLRE
jgi:formylglycine-generating enzyme required for sulfatase activity